MTNQTIIDIQHMLQQGKAAALAGDSFAARNLFRRATESDPTSADAWVGLSSVVPVLAEKREYLARALTLEPGNAEVRASLEYIAKLQAEGLQLAPAQRRAEQHASGNGSPLLSAPDVAAPAVAVEYCYRHPDRETGLHCISCNRPICGQCAFPTSVGQLCPECRKSRRPANYKVSAKDIILGGLVALFASMLVAVPLALFVRGFLALILIFVAGPAIAEFIVRVVDRVTKTKRGRAMQITMAVAVVLGTLPVFLFAFNIYLLLYLVLAVVTVVARMR